MDSKRRKKPGIARLLSVTFLQNKIINTLKNRVIGPKSTRQHSSRMTTNNGDNMTFLSQIFHTHSLAGKLNIAIVSLLVVVFGSSSLWLSMNLSSRLDTAGQQSLHAGNIRMINMIDAYASALENSATMLGAEFSQRAAEVLTEKGPNETTKNALVESFTRSTHGVATLFNREGDDFIRVATTLQNAEGKRATGTKLDHAHPAHALIQQGQSYTGRASLFGRDYMTHYAPLKDASGKVSGIAFIGIDFTESLAALKKQIREIRIGDTGYVYILDAGAQPGTLIVHPTGEGKNLLEAKAGDGRLFIQEMLKTKSGVIEYSSAESANQGGALRDKIAAYDTFPRWNWLIASSSFSDEFTRDARFVSTTLAITSLVIIVLIALCVTVLIRHWLARPLQTTAEAFQRMAKGDLGVQLKSDSTDEIGQMMNACGKMCDELRNMVQKIQSGMQDISREAEELMQMADNVSVGSREQSDAATALASSIEELSVGIEQIAGHSHETRKVVDDSNRISGSGSNVIEQAVAAMSGIADTVRFSSNVVSELGARTDEIARIVTVIREIADQTNLLALNAAIEAARAGEQGRGFAVVADEVRKLAERTTSSTQEIARTIERITAGARNAAESMDKGVNQVTEGVALASKAGSCIREMHDGSNLVGSAVAGIADSIREQSAASEHIASTVEEISSQAESNHEHALQAAEASRRMHKIARNTREMLGWFRL